MTYLATEMLLYLLAAAVIGLVLGWLFWGGRGRQLKTLHSDLEAAEAAHRETKFRLDGADAQTRTAIQKVKVEMNKSLAELKHTVEAERIATKQAEAALGQLRADVEIAKRKSRATNQEALDLANQAAFAERAAAAEAHAKEAQSRAQLEELRLLVGAEKLAAESARAELSEARASMEAKLEAEREHHKQAKIALDDIRSTLARTFGEGALTLGGGLATSAGLQGLSATDGGSADDNPTEEASVSADMTSFQVEADRPAAVMTDTGADLDDLDEADIEDWEDDSLDLPPTIDPNLETPEADIAAPAKLERVELRPIMDEPAKAQRPTILFDRQPDDIDDLKAIVGISEDLERRLHQLGLYHYRQLASFSQQDVDWLARSIDVTPYQIMADRWVEQAKDLQHQDGDDEPDGDTDDQGDDDTTEEARSEDDKPAFAETSEDRAKAAG